MSSEILRRAVSLKYTGISEVLSAFIIALNMEALSTSQTSVSFYETARRIISEDNDLHPRPCKNLK
jgi:hypothetical protein